MFMLFVILCIIYTIILVFNYHVKNTFFENDKTILTFLFNLYTIFYCIYWGCFALLGIFCIAAFDYSNGVLPKFGFMFYLFQIILHLILGIIEYFIYKILKKQKIYFNNEE